ncbi:hypothetical protein RclHR1_05650011 [Rhizophagus clarus]|uniref:Uncharacterized protein n=1 Tax=Rhizophagus clarus TaxID=94130 RepID=A0A2Z6RU84_9GLOM|nr:hypothetical protein RclHR1_05650011 [Rhizophagus clarus]
MYILVNRLIDKCSDAYCRSRKRQQALQQVKIQEKRGASGIKLFIISELLTWQAQFKGTFKGINTTEMGFNPSKIKENKPITEIMKDQYIHSSEVQQKQHEEQMDILRQFLMNFNNN